MHKTPITAGIYILSRVGLSLTFSSFGIPDYDQILSNNLEIHLSYPKVETVELDVQGNVHLTGDLYYRTFEGQSIQTRCAPFIVSSNMPFQFRTNDASRSIIQNSKSSYGKKFWAINPMDNNQGYRLFQDNKTDSITNTFGWHTQSFSPSGKYILVHKKSHDSQSITSAIVKHFFGAPKSPRVQFLHPMGKSRALIFNEIFSPNRTKMHIESVIGLVRDVDTKMDKLAAWEDLVAADGYAHPLMLNFQSTLIMPWSSSKHGTIISGSKHTVARTYEDFLNCPGDRMTPCIVQNKIDELTIHNLYYSYLVDEGLCPVLIPGAGTCVSSCGQFIFATLTRPSIVEQVIDLPDLAQAVKKSAFEIIYEAEKSIHDHPNIYFGQAKSGRLSSVAAKWVEATMGGSCLFSLKQLVQDLIDSQVAHQRRFVKTLDDDQVAQSILSQIDQLNTTAKTIGPWHFMEVFKTTYDSQQNLVIVGLGINPSGQYELFCIKAPEVEWIAILNKYLRRAFKPLEDDAPDLEPVVNEAADEPVGD
jgi:hypothetical protein